MGQKKLWLLHDTREEHVVNCIKKYFLAANYFLEDFRLKITWKVPAPYGLCWGEKALSLGCWPWRTIDNIVNDIGEEEIMTAWFYSAEEIKMCLLKWMTCKWEDLLWSCTLLSIFFVFRLTNFFMVYHFLMQKSELWFFMNTVLKIRCVFRL